MIAITSREITNRIDDESTDSRASERINLSMPGKKATAKMCKTRQNPLFEEINNQFSPKIQNELLNNLLNSIF